MFSWTLARLLALSSMLSTTEIQFGCMSAKVGVLWVALIIPKGL